jgi:prepilin-type N-terminal cleavage/methylation domain-containing protein
MSNRFMRKLMLRAGYQPKNQGFSLTEVVVSILVLSLFTLTSTSLMTYAAQGRVRARSGSELTDRIQLEMEQVRRAAKILSPSTSHLTAACNATSATGSFAELLSNSPDLPTVLSPATFSGRTYTITRTLSVVNAAPYDRLSVTYTIAPQVSGDRETITMQTEVIPDAAFTCS